MTSRALQVTGRATMTGVSEFDEATRAAMRDWLLAADRLDATTDERELLEHADAKALAALVLRRRLERLGWTPPASRSSVLRAPAAAAGPPGDDPQPTR